MQRAVIYVRVSGERQVSEGNGISSQIHRCEQYCGLKNYQVSKIFRDEGVSGKIEARPGITELLTYLTTNKGTVVVVDDQKRLARDIQVYLHLKQAIKTLNSRIEYLNHSFDDTPESNFIETILASTAQLEREQGARQVRQKMKARLEAGYWVWPLPYGYVFNKFKNNKIPVRVEPTASIIADMFAKFEARELRTITECQAYLLDYGIKMSKSATHKMLHNVLYTGHLEYEPWDIPLTKAHHEPIISYELYTNVQALIKPVGKFKKSQHDFHLRGHVICSHCGNNLTAGYSTSRNGAKHGYYFCQKRTCPLRHKTVSKLKLEGEFKELLESIEIKDERFYNMARIAWHDAVLELKDHWIGKRTQMMDRIATITKEIDVLVTRVSRTDNDLIADTYSNRIIDLTTEKTVLTEKIRLSEEPDMARAENIWNRVMTDYRTLSKQWDKADDQGKSLLYHRIFTDRIVYDINGGYRTAPVSPFYQTKRVSEDGKILMVDYTGRLLNILNALKLEVIGVM